MRLSKKQIDFIKERHIDRICEFVKSLIFFGNNVIDIDRVADLVYYELNDDAKKEIDKIR